ncbi:MAG: hypothetical protein JO006_15215 [Paucibacter sp.]|nr:hypothetical protein [Roseateles sp.]
MFGTTPNSASSLIDSIDASAINDTQLSLSSLSQLQSVSDSFQTALAQLLPPYLAGTSAANSSNPGVVSAAEQSNAPIGSYNVTVNHLAQTQALQSAALATPDQTQIGSGKLTITLGSYDAGSNTFTPGSRAPTTVSLNNATLDDVASAINAAGGGVAAQVNAVSGGYALVLSGSNPGASNAFEVQVDNAGLSSLSFDPTNPAGSGLTQTQTAQDASLSVNGAPISSGGNSGVSIAPGLTVNLLQPGSSVVTSSASDAAVQSLAQGLVSAYNAVQSGLANSSSNDAAQEVAGPYSVGLTAAVTNTYNVPNSSLGALSQIGVFVQAGLVGAMPNGPASTTTNSLSLNGGALSSSLSSDASGTQGLLGAVVQALYNVADSYGGGGGVLQSSKDAYQSALYNDQLVAWPSVRPVPPSVDQLANDQSGQSLLAPAQISSEQQYVRAFAPLQQSIWTSVLLSELYAVNSAASGGLLSAMA